jgi:hypothetical protein
VHAAQAREKTKNIATFPAMPPLTPAQRKAQLADLEGWLKVHHPLDVLMVCRALLRLLLPRAKTSTRTHASTLRVLCVRCPPPVARQAGHQEAGLQARLWQLDVGALRCAEAGARRERVHR